MKPLSYWLNQTSNNHFCALWNQWIEVLLESGATDFAKVPVQPEFEQDLFGDRLCVRIGSEGVRRALACPEAAGDGFEFALTWFDGIHWHTMPNDPLARPEQCTTAEYRKNLLSNAVDEVPALSEHILDLEQRIRSSKQCLAEVLSPRTEIKTIEVEDLEAVFAAGVAYGRRGLMEKIPVDGVKAGPDWYAVIDDAAARHGAQLTPSRLAEEMLGVVHERDFPDPNDPTSKITRIWYQWTSGVTIEVKEFAYLHGKWRDKNPLRPRGKRDRGKKASA